jgi:superfamily II DNA/RNA helicase
MSQAQREKAMQGFRDGTYDVLVATDIAARGIDVADVSHVINFDVPNTPDAYTHRIGRTGRSDKSGTACTFVTEEDGHLVRAIEKRLGMKLPRVRVDGYGGERRAKEAATPPTVFQRRAAPAAQAASRARGRPQHKAPARSPARPARSEGKARAQTAARPAQSAGKGHAKDHGGPAFGAGIPGAGQPL